VLEFQFPLVRLPLHVDCFEALHIEQVLLVEYDCFLRSMAEGQYFYPG
jgi:hypothetical protein